MTTHNNSQEKLCVAILFGGKSAEHEISIQSAKNVIAALDMSKFVPLLIGIDKQGGWHELADPDALATVPMGISIPDLKLLQSANVVFPILHGPLGEDGTMQGLLEVTGLPYVGCGVLSSAAVMDKDIAKRLLRAANIPVADCVVITAAERSAFDSTSVESFGLPLFVKPANMGSSIGVSKVEHLSELRQAIDLAFSYDRKILIEKAVIGDEVECAVLGNDQPRVSLPGRILPSANFYTYDAKYHDEDGTVLEIPAKFPEDLTQKIQAIALQAFKTLCCEGLARVDMFVATTGEVTINELNTIPGFTAFSMYPQLWGVSGITYTNLITQLLQLAIDRTGERQKLRTNYS